MGVVGERFKIHIKWVLCKWVMLINTHIKYKKFAKIEYMWAICKN